MQSEDITKPQPKRASQRRKRPPKPIAKTARPLSSNVIGSSTYILTFVFLVSTLLIYDIVFSQTVDFEALRSELINSVHAQTDAVNIVVQSLEEIRERSKSVHLNLIGSTGVGKTFVANILKRHFQPCVYELSPESDLEKVLYKLKAVNCKYDLVIIDDLFVADTDNLLDFVQKIPEDIVVLLVTVFNIQETDSRLNYIINYDHITEINEKLNSDKISYEMALFHKFNEDQINDWIVKQLESKEISVESHPHLVSRLLEQQNVKYYGLKGLSSKLNLEL